jgi:predicted GIY-YIG superfamily endonuclease
MTPDLGSEEIGNMGFVDHLGKTPHAVYRAYDPEGQLLYIGFGVDPDGRMTDHRNSTEWAKQCTRVELTWYDTRAEANAAETIAIKAEKPRYNVQHNQPKHQRQMTRITIDLPPDEYKDLKRWLASAAIAVNPDFPFTLSQMQGVRAMIRAAVKDELVSGVVVDLLREGTSGTCNDRP